MQNEKKSAFESEREGILLMMKPQTNEKQIFVVIKKNVWSVCRNFKRG